MDHRPSIMERAFELAKSGSCANAQEIKRTLVREGYEHAQAQISGRALLKQLLALCAAARPAPPA